MDYLKRLKQNEVATLQANPVAVPELAAVFEKGTPTLFYVATLNALEKDKMDLAYQAFKKRAGLSPDGVELYRVFAVAYLLCDENNVREAQNEQQLDQLITYVADLENRIASRLFAVCNGANRLWSLDEDLKKSTATEGTMEKSEGGNGESPSTSVSRRARPGSVASQQPNTQSSAT